MAARTKTGPWLTRSYWRAVYWAITEMPARLEAMLPPPATVPCSELEPAPAQPEDGTQCAWSPDATTNSSSMAVSTPRLGQSSGMAARGSVERLASS